MGLALNLGHGILSKLIISLLLPSKFLWTNSPRLLAEVENPTSYCSFTDFFAPNGNMIVLGDIAQGGNAILRSKQAMLPVDGSIQWNVSSSTVKSSKCRID